MAKRVYKDAEMRTKIMAGVDALADTLKVTLGPGGRNVVLENHDMGLTKRYITNDGATIAKALRLSDRAEYIGVELVRDLL